MFPTILCEYHAAAKYKNNGRNPYMDNAYSWDFMKREKNLTTINPNMATNNMPTKP